MRVFEGSEDSDLRNQSKCLYTGRFEPEREENCPEM
jgi:hypothetical protein